MNNLLEKLCFHLDKVEEIRENLQGMEFLYQGDYAVVNDVLSVMGSPHLDIYIEDDSGYSDMFMISLSDLQKELM